MKDFLGFGSRRSDFWKTCVGQLSRESCVSLLSRYSFEVYDRETVEVLRTAIEENVLDGTIAPSDVEEAYEKQRSRVESR